MENVDHKHGSSVANYMLLDLMRDVAGGAGGEEEGRRSRREDGRTDSAEDRSPPFDDLSPDSSLLETSGFSPEERSPGGRRSPSTSGR